MKVRFYICALFGIVLATTSMAESSLEYKVKAAFLLNFIRYTDWPAKVFPTETSSAVICILGKDPFGEILDQTIAGKKVYDRNLEIQRIALNGPSLDKCHVIFISKMTKSELNEVKGLVNNRPVLIVQDSNGTGHEEGMIHFIAVENNVRFEINLEMAEKAGLKFSSRMMALSDKIYE